MKNEIKKTLSSLLIVLMLFTSVGSAFAYDITTVESSLQTINNEKGIVIHGKYYTKEEFEILLDGAIKISESGSSDSSVTTYSLTMTPLLAGTWWVPGVGEVVITTAGLVIVAGAVYTAGSWVYDTVVGYFTKRNYNNSKDKCKPSNNRKTTRDYRNTPRYGEAYSTLDIYKNGKVMTRRYFDKNGNADLDIDFFHTNLNNSHTFPHCHKWMNGQRTKGFPCCK